MKDPKYYGTSLFLYGKVGTDTVMVGCATGFKRSVKNSPQDVSCPGNGKGKTYVPGKMPDYDLSFDGISYVYTGADIATNIGVKSFWDNCATGTVIEIIQSPGEITAVGLPANVSTLTIEKTTFVVESCDETAKFGEASTYSVSGKASGGWISQNIAV